MVLLVDDHIDSLQSLVSDPFQDQPPIWWRGDCNRGHLLQKPRSRLQPHSDEAEDP
jgi:hypothetical protein